MEFNTFQMERKTVKLRVEDKEWCDIRRVVVDGKEIELSNEALEKLINEVDKWAAVAFHYEINEDEVDVNVFVDVYDTKLGIRDKDEYGLEAILFVIAREILTENYIEITIKWHGEEGTNYWATHRITAYIHKESKFWRELGIQPKESVKVEHIVLGGI